MPWKKTKTVYTFFTKKADALRQRRIIGLFSKNPQKFERIYEARRLHYQKEFAEIVNALSKFGIKVSVGEAEIVTKKREKTGHAHLEVKGIQSVGGGIDWVDAQKYLKSKFSKMEQFGLSLKFFYDFAKHSGLELHEFPQDVPLMLEAIQLFVMSRGTNHPVI